MTIVKAPSKGTKNKGYPYLKRCFDFFGALLGLMILFLIFPIIVICIKIDSPGPLFFVQTRVGQYGHRFKFIKFRTMKVGAHLKQWELDNLNESGGLTFKMQNDPRITKVGKFLRQTSLDEMPQFLNVLLGDMSVVGPRPHLWAQNKTYGNKVKKYMVRHYVKPGITGLAQVSGFRGEIETEADMINRIKFYVFYIENWSLILDLKIIFQTVINILKGEEKAY